MRMEANINLMVQLKERYSLILVWRAQKCPYLQNRFHGFSITRSFALLLLGFVLISSASATMGRLVSITPVLPSRTFLSLRYEWVLSWSRRFFLVYLLCLVSPGICRYSGATAKSVSPSSSTKALLNPAALKKKCFTMRSSKLWKEMTARRPLGDNRAYASARANSRVRSSSLTAIRRAWNVLVAGCTTFPLPGRPE